MTSASWARVQTNSANVRKFVKFHKKSPVSGVKDLKAYLLDQWTLLDCGVRGCVVSEESKQAWTQAGGQL